MDENAESRERVFLNGILKNSVRAIQEGDIQWAHSLLSRSIERFPLEGELYMNRALVLMEQERYKMSLEDLGQAIKLDPTNTYAYMNRAISRDKCGDRMGALEDYSSAIEIEPKNADLYYDRGVAFLDWQQLEEAIADFTKAIEIDCENADFYNNRANAYADQGKYSQAVSDFTKAIDVDPIDTVLYDNRGITYGKMGKFELALNDYEMSVMLEPLVMEKHLSKMETEIILGRLSEATRTFKKCGSMEARNDDRFNLRFLQVVLETLKGSWRDDLDVTFNVLQRIVEEIKEPVSWDFEDLRKWGTTLLPQDIPEEKRMFLLALIEKMEQNFPQDRNREL